MKTVSLYAAPLLVAGLFTLAQILGLTWIDAGLAVFAFLLHAPSLVPVRTIRQGVGDKLGLYPETPFFAFIFVAWGAAGLLHSPFAFAILAGLSFSVSVGLQFILVRVIDLIVRGALFVGGHNPKFDPESLISVTKRNVFLLRVMTSLISLLLCWMFIAGSIDTVWWLPAVVLAPLLSAASVALRGMSMKAIADRAARSAGATISAEVAKNPPKCVFYYSSGKLSGHDRLASSVRRFSDAGIPNSVICREPHAFKACQTIKPDHLWRGYTIDTLDVFTQPSIKAAVYVNVAPKNPHFIRFNDRVHVLLADEGNLAKQTSMPGSLEVYDAILAPSAKQAAQWRRFSPAGIASRVVLIDPKAVSLPSSEKRESSNCCVSLNLGAGSVPETSVYQRTAILNSVLKWISEDERRKLIVNFDEATKEMTMDDETKQVTGDAGQQGIKQLLSIACHSSPGISIVQNAGTSVHLSSDVIIASEADDVSSLAHTGKPVLLFEPASWRKGVELLWGTQAEVFELLNKASKGFFVIDGPDYQRRHFTSLEDMIDGVFEEKQSTGVSL